MWCAIMHARRPSFEIANVSITGNENGGGEEVPLKEEEEEERNPLLPRRLRGGHCQRQELHAQPEEELLQKRETPFESSHIFLVVYIYIYIYMSARKIHFRPGSGQ